MADVARKTEEVSVKSAFRERSKGEKMSKCSSEEIAAVLRAELEGGQYKAGSRLPSVMALRRRFTAGEFVVRHALQRLRDEEFISLKPRMGAVATGKGSYAWKGRVAFVVVDSSAAYFRQKLAVCMARHFREAGWDFIPVFLEQTPDGDVDLSSVRRYAANGLDFAILMTSRRQIAELCDGLSLPYVVLNGFTRDFPNAKAVIREDFHGCFAELIDTLHERRLKTVAEFDIERTMDRSFKSQFFESGISVRYVLCEWDKSDSWTLSDVRQCGYEAVKRFFEDARNRKHPPDVILFDDDYLATGGIMALKECGIRVPDDVRLVTYSNRGNEPSGGGVTLAKVEADPVSYADTVAAYVLELLSGRQLAPPRISWRFVPGESL